MTMLGSCERNEATTLWGPGKCVATDDCKGARWCSATGFCIGDDLCDSKLCLIDEYKNKPVPGACDTRRDCRG